MVTSPPQPPRERPSLQGYLNVVQQLALGRFLPGGRFLRGCGGDKRTRFHLDSDPK